MTTVDNPTEVLRLARPEGAVAYEVSGEGPLIVCVPGMGDLRASYRFLQPDLVAGGHRVAVMDLRGHGDSDHSFSEYGDLPTAADIEALVRHLGGPAVLVGNSMAAGSAVIVAARYPELVRGLVLIGPFVRDPAASALMRLATRALMARPWAAAAWKMYLPKLYAGALPDDFVQYRDTLVAAIRRPGYAKAFSATTRTHHTEAEQALAGVTAPALIVMGQDDPDFPDTAAEAAWIAEQLHGEMLMVPNAGHYPQSQRPDLVGPAITAFANRLSNTATTGRPR